MPSISITAAVVGAAGAIGSSAMSSSASGKAAKQAMTGYNYLTTGAGSNTINSAETAGIAATNNQTQSLGNQRGVVDTMNSLLTSDGQNNPAFQNYLKSTGYNFQLDTGSRAITDNAASKGLLNSGATAKALTQYGQNLGSSYFNNYLNQLSSVAGNYGNNAAGYGNQANMGLNAATAVGNAGTGAGSAAAQYTQAGGNTIASGISSLAAQTQNVLPYLMG